MTDDMTNDMVDVIIVGGGIAGATAGIYAARSGYKVLMIERLFVGGQAATTDWIDNYPGFDEGISGVDLSMKLDAQAKRFGVEIITDTITKIEPQSKTVYTEKGEYKANNLILAMGAVPKKLDVPGEEKFAGKGVSYCATCDGQFYRGKTALVVGGGDTALEDACYLANLCEKVYLVHRRDKFRGQKILQDKVSENPKITVILNSRVTEIIGENSVSAVKVIDLNNTVSEINTEGVFVAVGTSPQTQLVKGLIDLDENGYIITNENMLTSCERVFAVGDIRNKSLRQIVTAASDGAIAGNMISGLSPHSTPN